MCNNNNVMIFGSVS